MIIFAVNINSGGGLILLKEALTSKKFGKVSTVFIDERCPIDQSFENIRLIKVKPSLISRFKAEFQLSKMVKKNQEEVLFFGNLPSIFKIESKTKLFLQNAYILRNVGLPKNLYHKLRCLFERSLFYLFVHKIDQIIVQTDWMKKQISALIDNQIIVDPFHSTNTVEIKKFSDRSFDLILITGPEEHKNLDLVKSALKETKDVLNICFIANTELNIENSNISLTCYKNIKQDEVFQLLSDSRYLLLVSEFESYCLPYYEALATKTKIISADKGYADKRDIELKNLTVDEVLKSFSLISPQTKEVK